jgi:hypothetical protein
MRKNVLALSIAAMIGGLGFAGAASAQLAVNASGAGHMLLVPYYTAQNGNMSVFHVVNTDTVNGKAVKVRFRGAANSDDVLDFQVFMSPGDVWTAAVTKGANDVAQLVTADGTCTLPTIAKNTPVSFVRDRLPSTMAAADKANNTREGYVEILNMADIDGAKTYTVGSVANTNSALYTATKHVNGVAPCTDTVLNGTLTGGTTGLTAPTGGLMGSWYVINVPQTTTFSGATNAIVATGATRNVFSPQTTGAAALPSADPLFKSAVLTSQNYDVPDLSTPYLTATTNDQAGADSQAGALTAILARTAVMNQYATDAEVTAKTDWVFSMPTRRYSIAANYGAAVGTTYGNALAGSLDATAPSSNDKTKAYRVINTAVGSYFTSGNTAVNTAGQICLSSIGQVFRDREETSKTTGAVFSPGNVTLLPLCGEVSVLNFASGSVLGASVAAGAVNGAYTNGWGQINFAAPGVPVLGAAFIKVTNPNASAGVSGNYGITWPHAYQP